MRVYRLCKARHAANALDGEGAFLVGGRWNMRGQRVAYSSESRALTVLEVLVHAQPEDLVDFSLVVVELDTARVVSPSLTGIDWQSPSTSTDLGSQWFKQRLSPVVAVPSAVIPEERNFLLYPAHPDFAAAVSVNSVHPFSFDERLKLRTG